MAYAHQLPSNTSTLNFMNLLLAQHSTRHKSYKPSINETIPLIELQRHERLRLIRQWKHYSQNPYFCSLDTEKTQDAVIVDFAASRDSSLKQDSALVFANSEWEVSLPLSGSCAYTTIIRPFKVMSSLEQMSVKQELALEQILVKLATRYDNLFFTSLRCKITWWFDSNSQELMASYQPLDTSLSRFDVSNHEEFAARLAGSSDIHFKDVF